MTRRVYEQLTAWAYGERTAVPDPFTVPTRAYSATDRPLYRLLLVLNSVHAVPRRIWAALGRYERAEDGDGDAALRVVVQYLHSLVEDS